MQFWSNDNSVILLLSMTIENTAVVKCGDKLLYLFGDRHMYNGEDLSEATLLHNRIVQLVENGAYAFIEFSTYELEHAKKDGGKLGLRFKIPVLLDDLHFDLKSRIHLHDCRSSTTTMPLISWLKVTYGLHLTTNVTWKNCKDIVEDTKLRLETMEESNVSNLLTIARNVFDKIYPSWLTVQKQLGDSLDETLDKLLKHNKKLNYPMELNLLYEVGLLCDISSVVSATNFVGVVFCGVDHVNNILCKLQEFGWELETHLL